MTSPVRPIRVHFDDFRAPDGRVFSGRDRGRRARRKAELDKLDRAGRHVEVHIPDDVFSVTSSFFLAMFGPSIRYHGKIRFRELYSFTGWDATRVLDLSIREALDPTSPL